LSKLVSFLYVHGNDYLMQISLKSSVFLQSRRNVYWRGQNVGGIEATWTRHNHNTSGAPLAAAA